MFLFVASLAASSWAAYAKPQPAFYLTPFRMCEFLLGSTVVFLGHKRPPRALGPFLAPVGLVLILASALLFDQDTLFPCMMAMIPCLGIALIIFVGKNDPDTLVVRLLRQPVLTFIGRASYLVHWPIIVFKNYFLVNESSIGLSILAAMASILLGIVVWRWVEVPFRN